MIKEVDTKEFILINRQKQRESQKKWYEKYKKSDKYQEAIKKAKRDYHERHKERINARKRERYHLKKQKEKEERENEKTLENENN